MIVQSDSKAWEVVSGHRTGDIAFKRLLAGRETEPNNFYMSLVRTGAGYYTPRHKHNFDQFRYVISGELNYGSEQALPTGAVGYFPEGTYYGPQDEDREAVSILLQFGSASGSGYMSQDELERGFEELQSVGEFKDGVFSKTKPGGGKVNRDSYEAIWEHHNQRELVYPNRRFSHPVIMFPEAFDWVESAPGVQEKHLAAFNERKASVGLIKFSANTQKALGDAEHTALIYGLSGRGVLSTGEELRSGTAMKIEPSEDVSVQCVDEFEALRFLLPAL